MTIYLSPVEPEPVACRTPQCLRCGRFVRADGYRVETGPTWDLPDIAIYSCSRCGPMKEPL